MWQSFTPEEVKKLELYAFGAVRGWRKHLLFSSVKSYFECLDRHAGTAHLPHLTTVRYLIYTFRSPTANCDTSPESYENGGCWVRWSAKLLCDFDWSREP